MSTREEFARRIMNVLEKQRKQKGAGWSARMNSFVRTVDGKKKTVRGITKYIQDLAHGAYPVPISDLEVNGDEEKILPCAVTSFTQAQEGMPCRDTCYGSGGQKHGSYVHNEFAHYMAYQLGNRVRPRLWDPCFAALLKAFDHNGFALLCNEYVMVSAMNYATAADLFVTNAAGQLVLLELKCTRDRVDARFSPHPSKLVRTSPLSGMPVNEYTTSMVQLLIMVELLRAEYGINLIGRRGSWEQRAARAQVVRVGRPLKKTDNPCARVVTQFVLDKRIYDQREDIMTHFAHHVQKSKKQSKQTANRKRKISKAVAASRPKVVAKNAAKRRKKLVDPSRARINRFKERPKKYRLDLRWGIAQLAARWK